MRKMMKHGIQEYLSYVCTILYPNRVIKKVAAAITEQYY